MKQIKTLTVNGESYRITDPEAARVEQLCPLLTESGAAVRCTPVKDYPLQVVSHLQAQTQSLTLHHCGKNILDVATAGVYHCNAALNIYHNLYVTQTGLRIEPLKLLQNDWTRCGVYIGTAKELAGKTITLSAKMKTTIAKPPNAQIFATNVTPTSVRENPKYSDGGYTGSTGSVKSLAEAWTNNGYAYISYTVTGEEAFSYICAGFYLTHGGTADVGDWTEWSDIQVEIGDAPTAYEPYRGQTYTAQPGGADSYAWADVQGLPGVNTLWCDDGTVTVTGRADPVAELEMLKNAIIALGGNV